MVTNKKIENAVFEKYPNSRIERGINFNIVQGYEKILNKSFVLKLNSNQRNYKWLLGSAFIATLPITIPMAIYRDKQYEEGVEIKSVDVMGEEFSSKYYKLPFFSKYIYQEASRRGIDANNYSDRPKIRVEMDNENSMGKVMKSIAEITAFDDFIKNRYLSKESEILELYGK